VYQVAVIRITRNHSYLTSCLVAWNTDELRMAITRYQAQAAGGEARVMTTASTCRRKYQRLN